MNPLQLLFNLAVYAVMFYLGMEFQKEKTIPAHEVEVDEKGREITKKK